MDMAGETESMYMIETLNQEFDVVVNENEQLKKEIELLKRTINYFPQQLEKCKEHYEDHDVHCYSCMHLIEYDEEFVIMKGGSMCEKKICQECIDDDALAPYLDENNEDAPINGFKFTWMNGSSIN